MFELINVRLHEADIFYLATSQRVTSFRVKNDRTFRTFWRGIDLSKSQISLIIATFSPIIHTYRNREVPPRDIRVGPQYYASQCERLNDNSADSRLGSALFLCPRGLKT